MAQQTPSVLEIDRKLRDDFRRRVKDFGVGGDTVDPLLSVLFRTVAQQIDQVYGDAAQLRQSMLHELMNGLDIQQFLARPAQAVIRLVNDMAEPRTLRAGTELNAIASSGERLTFTLDQTVEVSQARLALALSYQNQSLRLLSGVELTESMHALRPSMEAVPLALGDQPAIILAFENLPARLLSRHGLFFELGPGTYAIQHALSHEPWWLHGADGELSGDGLLRPIRRSGGVHELCFQSRVKRAGAPGTPDETDETLPVLADGFHGGRQFLFPVMDENLEVRTSVPRLLRAPLATMVERGLDQWLAEPRIWLRIPMPPSVPQLHHAINNILLHTATVSNLFTRNQTISFSRDGLSVPVIKAGGAPEHLVAPLSINSETNDPYEPGARIGANAAAGWFELQNGRLTLHPGLSLDGTPHRAANVRLWLTNGRLGNQVGPGDITGFANAAALQGIRITPVTAAAGGSDGEDKASEERRFADALLTRRRIVTEGDLKTAALALDRRVLSAQSHSAVKRTSNGLERVLTLELTLDSAAFLRPELELESLKSQIESSLRKRLVAGLVLEVEFLWK